MHFFPLIILGFLAVLNILLFIYLFFKKFREAKGAEHEHFRYVMYGTMTMFFLVMVTISVAVMIFHNTDFAFLAALYAVFFLGMILYAIVKHRFLDRSYYENNKLLAQLTRIMAESIELESMTSTILKLLVKELGLMKAAFLIIEEDKVTDIISINYKKSELTSSKLAQLFSKYLLTQPHFILEELSEGTLRDFFRKNNISIVIPIKVENRNVAILVLGPRLFGEIYHPKDINLLNVFASEAGIAIQHAKVYAQIREFNIILERRVAERTKSLSQQNKKVQKQNKKITAQNDEIGKLLKEKTDLLAQKSNFSVLTAHELQAPLRAALLQTNAIISKNRDTVLNEDLVAIQKILEKLKEMTDKLFEALK